MAGSHYQLYHEDAYRKGMEAIVLRTEGDKVVLDRTVFYPRRRQPSDRGRLT